MIMNLLHAVKEATKPISLNAGQGIDDVKERQRRRKMMALREGCKRALWFADSFNVDLLRVVFQSRKTREPINIVYEEGAHACTNNVQVTSFYCIKYCTFLINSP